MNGSDENQSANGELPEDRELPDNRALPENGPFVEKTPVESSAVARPSEVARTSAGARWSRRLLPPLILIGSLIALSMGKSELIALREQFGLAAPLVTVPIHAVVAAAPVPSDVIVIANGAVYPYLLAVGLSWLGWMIGSIIEFQTVRSVAKLKTFEDAGSKMPEWLRRFPADNPIFLILGRQIPGVGAHITTITAAAAGVGYPRYLWCTAIAILPGALLYCAIGAKLL